MLFPLILAAAAAVSYPPQGYERERSFDSPKHTFQVESWRKDGQEPGAALCVWIVTPDRNAAELLVPPGVLTPLYSVEIHISPDEHSVLWEEKLYHRADAYGLFERVSGIHFREIGPPLFHEQAWRFMSQQTHRQFTPDYNHIMRVSDWPVPGSRIRKLALYGDAQLTPVTAPNDHSLAISLYGDDQKTSVNLWFCFYDLEKHQFYLDDALRKHNKGTVGPSRERPNQAMQPTAGRRTAEISMTPTSHPAATRALASGG